MHDAEHGDEHVKKRLTPLAAKGNWRPVSLEQDIINVKGGYNTRGESGKIISYVIDKVPHVFVELDKNAPWFLKGVGGAKIQKGDLKPVLVMSLLRQMLQDKLDDEPGAEAAGDQGHPAAVAESQSDSQDPPAVDPMEAMDALMDVPSPAKKKKRKTTHNGRAVVEKLEVPTRPLCTGCVTDGNTTVWVYKKPSPTTRGNANLWLRVDGVEWLLAYAADELHFQGVVQSTIEPSTPQLGNCTAVADLFLEWDFSAKAWDATFVAGAMKGTSKRMCVHELTRDVWEKLREREHVQGYIGHATVIEKKCALRQWMTLWGAARLVNKADEFEAMEEPCASPDEPCASPVAPWLDECVGNIADDNTAVAALFDDTDMLG